MKILLNGYGYMGKEYAKILRKHKIEFIIVKQSYKDNDVDEKIIYGGIEKIIKKDVIDCTHAIIATPIDKLEEHLEIIINLGIVNILIEKPGGLNTENMRRFVNYNIYVAYNRRFYKSVCELLNRINYDGGITSFTFNMTELINKIDISKYNEKVLNKWIISMTSHLLDLVFFICGKPDSITCKTITKNKISWHANEIFIGHGNIGDILFSYHGNWLSGGRWKIEICTNNGLYILCPLEELSVQYKGEFEIKNIELETDEFKCGLEEMVNSYLFNNNDVRLVTLKEQCDNIDYIYNIIGGYK